MAKTYGGTIQHGSSGNDVRAWQEFLKSQGFNLAVDGMFGDDTRKYTVEYQNRIGLNADGIVGKDTWGKAGFVASSPSPISAPNLAPAPTMPTYNTTNYEDTLKGKGTMDAMEAADKAVKDYGDFTYSKDDLFNETMNKILNREKFSYDLNGDALYQQYKDKYIKQGRMAMEDTMGQAAAMTGGYGNSYAQSAGQQAYNAHLENLNDIVPELYQMAYDRYRDEGQDLYNKYSMLSDDKSTEYGMWGDGYNRLVGERDYATNSHYNAADLYNADRDTGNALKQNTYTNEFNAWDANNKNAQFEAAWNRDNQWHAEDMAIAKEELELKKKSLNNSNYSGGNTSGNTGNNGSKPTNNNNNNNNNTNDTPLKAVNSKAVGNFKASIKTKNEFYTRGGYDKEKYKTYEGYIEGILDKWLSQGKLTEDEVATLLNHYGLA